MVSRAASAARRLPFGNLLDRLEQMVERSALGEPESAGLQRLAIELMLRATARALLASARLCVPEAARLFAIPADEAELERECTTDAVLSAELARAVEFLTHRAGSGSGSLAPELLGSVFESLLSIDVEGVRGGRQAIASRRRRATGSFFTPAALADQVVGSALAEASKRGRVEAADFTICDPACGAGAFLVAAARALVRMRQSRCVGPPLPEQEARRRVVRDALVGVDLNPLACAVAELSLWMYVADPSFPASGAGRLFAGDALTGPGFAGRHTLASAPTGLDWTQRLPDVLPKGFDVVIGNPPWIAYAGRATQPLAPDRRAFFAASYAAFRGYPTLHAVFVERALELARDGVVALVVPSPLADLDGYRPMRRVLRATHVPCEPLLEFGQDAFAEVTQPCFALVARPLEAGDRPEPGDTALRLVERSRRESPARRVEPPAALARLNRAERLPRELFGEMGLQTTRLVTQTLLLRADAPDSAHTYPLLEGRQVHEFRVGAPRLFLRPDADLLRRTRCRLRPAEDYCRVRFVVRQTARVPIAALHSGVPFRNSLLAGFENEELPADLLVGLLNSSLYRALHLAGQRDARQAAFPQVKVAHLRALPRPPRSARVADVRDLVRTATESSPSASMRRDLDDAVFALFDFSASDRAEVLAFLEHRAPELLDSPSR